MPFGEKYWLPFAAGLQLMYWIGATRFGTSMQVHLVEEVPRLWPPNGMGFVFVEYGYVVVERDTRSKSGQRSGRVIDTPTPEGGGF
jgi:hypothetical protein